MKTPIDIIDRAAIKAFVAEVNRLGGIDVLADSLASRHQRARGADRSGRARVTAHHDAVQGWKAFSRLVSNGWFWVHNASVVWKLNPKPWSPTIIPMSMA